MRKSNRREKERERESVPQPGEGEVEPRGGRELLRERARPALFGLSARS